MVVDFDIFHLSWRMRIVWFKLCLNYLSYLVERRQWLLLFRFVSKKSLTRDHKLQSLNTIQISAKILGFVTNAFGFPCHGDIVKCPWMFVY